MKPANYLTPVDISKLYPVSAEKVRNWITTGQLKGHNISASGKSNRWVVSEEEWDKFWERRSSTAMVNETKQRVAVRKIRRTADYERWGL